MATIKEQFQDLRARMKADLAKLQQKIAEEEKEYEAKDAEVGTAIAKETGLAASEALANKVQYPCLRG